MSPPEGPIYPAYRMPSGIQIQDLAVPDAQLAASWGDLVTLDYTIKLEDGSVADSSVERGQAVSFTLGQGQVPRGLEEGLVGLELLGRRLMTIPAELGYGSEGRPPRIPPNAVLFIEVELLAIERDEVSVTQQ